MAQMSSEIPADNEIDGEKIFNKLVEKQEEKILSDRQKAELEIVKELNSKHAVVHTSQMYILTEKCNRMSGETTFCLETKKSFLDTYENKLASLPKEGTKERELISKAKVWIKHLQRREFLNGITFDPTIIGHSPTQYNIWKGFAVIPKQGDCKKFLDFVRYIICDGDDRKYIYVINWMAYLVQFPDRVGAALLLMGLQGIGKNFFVETLGHLLGQHFIQLSSLKELVGNFNSHLQNAVLIHANEAIWGGNKTDLGKVKSMITEKFVLIEGKGKDTIPVRNYRHLIFSSNEDWPVHLDADDRRFMVLKVSPEMKEDTKYFGAIGEELDQGGYEALLDHLLSIDLSAVDIRVIPQTDDALDIKLQSVGDCARYIYQVLLYEHFNIGSATPQGSWSDCISKEVVRADYHSWCNMEGVRPVNGNALGRDLKKYTGAGDKKLREGKERTSCYEWKSLNHARKHFEKAFKVSTAVWE